MQHLSNFVDSDKIFDKSNLRKQGYELSHSLKIQSGKHGGKAWWCKREAAQLCHPLSGSRERELVPRSVSPWLLFLQFRNLWDGVAQIHDELSLETPSQTYPEVCLPSDSKSSLLAMKITGKMLGIHLPT